MNPIEEKAMILLVEDNHDDVDLTLRAFKKNNLKDEIIIARDGQEALDFLYGTGKHEGRDVSVLPKIVLLDLKLPRVNGFDVLKKIRETPETSRLPVVLLTSSKEDKDLKHGYDLGANSYVRKPVDFKDFMEVVKQLGMYWLIVNEVAPPH